MPRVSVIVRGADCLRGRLFGIAAPGGGEVAAVTPGVTSPHDLMPIRVRTRVPEGAR